MLFVDGFEYQLYKLKDENELEKYTEKLAKKIFGQDSYYFSVKKKIKSISGIGSIPDAYAISLTEPPKWYLVEVELSTHSIYNHIVPQLNKFIQGLKKYESRKIIIEALYDEIKNDPVLEARVKKAIGSSELFRFLSSTIDKEPGLVVVIDKKIPELQEAIDSIPLSNKEIVEFQIYKGKDSDEKSGFLFNPIKHTIVKPVKRVRTETIPSRITDKNIEYKSRGFFTIPLLETIYEMGGKGNWIKVLEKVGERVKDDLLPGDYHMVGSGDGWARWRNNAYYRVTSLKQRGLIKKGTKRGSWEISEEGIEFLRNQRDN